MKPKSSERESSKYLIFHVHGGGFTAQTSKSHDVYLREWAAKSCVPILSIDYNLTPDAPFPRALEEVFYTYCWALNNPKFVGSTGENIVFVGDSAGANLITACTIKCIEMGIKKPKGLLNIYGTFMVNYSITPSRFLSLFDPILPHTIICRLLKNYCEDREQIDLNGNTEESQGVAITMKKKVKRNQKNVYDSVYEEFNIKFLRHHLISPHIAPDEILAEFPPTKLLSTNMDPFVDDSIEFGKKLRKLKVQTTVDVVNGLPHGFLYFGQVKKRHTEDKAFNYST